MSNHDSSKPDLEAIRRAVRLVSEEATTWPQLAWFCHQGVWYELNGDDTSPEALRAFRAWCEDRQLIP